MSCVRVLAGTVYYIIIKVFSCQKKFLKLLRLESGRSNVEMAKFHI